MRAIGPDFGKIEALRRFGTERCVGQSLRRSCSQALPEAQKATVTANKFAGRSRAKGGGSARDRRQQECDTPPRFFASITLGRDAVARPADVSSFLPLLNTDRVGIRR